jgi:sec-independent protein translocase protein TatA
MTDTLAFLSPWEIAIVLIVALLLFGTRLPKVARSLGQGLSEFKTGLKGVKDDIEHAGEDTGSDEPTKPAE